MNSPRMVFQLGQAGGVDASSVVGKLLSLVKRNNYTPKLIVWAHRPESSGPGFFKADAFVATCYAAIRNERHS